MGYINKSHFANIRDELYANGSKIAAPQDHCHGIVGDVEIIATTRRGKARFTKTLKAKNDLLIGGANFFSEKVNGFRSSFRPLPIDVEYGLHTLNDLKLDSETIKNETICGMTIGIDGCVNTYNTVKPVLTHSRVVPGMIPFRKMRLDEEAELMDPDTRAKYFMRVEDNNGYVSYYGKTFDTTPMIYTEFEDGTEVASSVSSFNDPKAIKHYTKYILTIEGKDVREFFKIRDRSAMNSGISSAGLVSSYPGTATDGKPEWFNVRQLTMFNFEKKALKDSESTVQFIYRLNIR